ncbi:RING finger protein 24-like isoform X1 [Mytilus edulis]|uniref:RING finger protein 24-like isoform X1 n=1 Tax=Mytilus edulis TaxID=6550 RepID=UPI0039F0F186
MTDIPPNVSLPLLGIGLISLLLSFIFCIYMWRLRCRAREERGYNRIQFKEKNKKFSSKFKPVKKKRVIYSSMCAVCLEEFRNYEYIAICRCKHCFHMNCLLQWLKHRNFCPMCKATVQRVPSGERSSLIIMPQQAVPSTSNELPVEGAQNV